MCPGSSSVLSVLTKLVEADVNRLVVVDTEGRVEGIVTVSDIIYFLVLDRSKARGQRKARRVDSIGEEIGLEITEEDEDPETDSGTQIYSVFFNQPKASLFCVDPKT